MLFPHVPLQFSGLYLLRFFWALLERTFLSAFTGAVEWVSFGWLMVFTMALLKVLFSGQ